MRIPSFQGVWEISHLLLGPPHFPEGEGDLWSSSVRGCRSSCTWPSSLWSAQKGGSVSGFAAMASSPEGSSPNTPWIQWLHMVSARTLPAIFIWNPASSKYGNGPGICLSWWSFSCQFWGNKPQELNNSPFQSQKPTTFMPQTLGDSNTLIPLVSAFKTQRSPS